MDTATSYVTQAFDFVHHSYLTVDAQFGLLIIAVIAAFVMKGWKQIWPMALFATVVEIVLMAIWPALAHHARFQLPDFFLLSFWGDVLALYIGFVVVIAIFYLLKTMLVKTAAKAG